jgi:hypothetical protein
VPVGGDETVVERECAVVSEEEVAFGDADFIVFGDVAAPREPLECSEHCIDGGHHVGVGPAERRQTESAQSVLQGSDVVASQLDVVHEIDRRAPA